MYWSQENDSAQSVTSVLLPGSNHTNVIKSQEQQHATYTNYGGLRKFVEPSWNLLESLNLLRGSKNPLLGVLR
eukprot:4961698-Heterocapsa_arctica.AAC.1